MPDRRTGPDGRRPDLSSEEGRLAFIRVLNERLPTKRAIAQGVLGNSRGELLLCELTYKREWDLPGGVVDPGESPATAVEREVREELGLAVTAGRLLAVNWLPPWRGWDDAVLFLFDLGAAPDELPDTATLLAHEIRALHWLAAGDAAPHVAPYTATMLAGINASGTTAYLENSQPRTEPRP